MSAEGEEALAEHLAEPLREAGYEVTHEGTVSVGESLVGEAAKALESDSPIVLCATARAAGSQWAHRIVNAGHRNGPVRVFVVQMEKQAYVDHLALKAKVAKYCDDPAGALRELLDALKKHFPPVLNIPAPPKEERVVADGQFLDQITESVTFDIEALHRFRGELREEVATQYPAALSAWEFLDRTGLRIDGWLTRTGVLLFAKNPTVTFPTAIVKCAQYYGTGRGDSRDIVTYEDTVPGQIVRARQFVADRVRLGEAPSTTRAQSTVVFYYPMVAVREIIANALVHRDYAVTDACVHVRLFSDRLEVSSPGTWHGGNLSIGAEYKLASLAGQSIKRNSRLAHILSWVRLVEGEGSGIPSALRDCRATQTPTPTVVQEQGCVTVTLRRRMRGPAQLPADVNRFTGRAAELAELDRLLTADQTSGADSTAMVLAAVSGTAGVGKTALVLHWAHRVRSEFPDGQLYVNLRGYDPAPPMPVEDALAGFLRALGLARQDIPPEVDECSAAYRSLLDGRRMLVLLDNAASVEQVRPLLPGTRSCVVVVTSRDSLAGLAARHGARRLNLDLLPTEDAVALLRALIGEQVEAEPDAAVVLAEQCARLPLALRMVAELVAARPGTRLAGLVDELADEHRRLDLLNAGGDLRAAVRGVFSWSYQRLPADAARAFRLLGLHAGRDFDPHAAAALADTSLERAQHLLDVLARGHLIEFTRSGRYGMHDLLRAYATHLAAQEDTEEERREALTRLLDR
ncbi:MAG: ATP-binding protein [Pseudonocardiaceae bacterium]